MGHLKYGTNWHKKTGVSAVLGANDDKYVGGAAGNMRSEASFKRGTHNLTTKNGRNVGEKGYVSAAHNLIAQPTNVLILNYDVGRCGIKKENLQPLETFKSGRALGIPMQEMEKGLGIRLGDGNRVVTKGKCSKLEVSVGKYTCEIDAWVLDMGGLDVILGVAWLRTLGDVTTNWETMTMKFSSQGKEVELRGHDSQCLTSLHSLIGSDGIQNHR
ncbi:Aspartic peptidase domain superfamily, partial [Sesbania bispinosa]